MTEASKYRSLKASPPRRFVPCIAGLAGVGLVGLVDWWTGSEISLSILYLLPIGLTTWFGGLRSGLLVSFAATGVWLTLDSRGVSYSRPFIPYWNALVRMGFFLLTALLLNRVRSLTLNLEALITKRTAALVSEVEQRKQVEREVAEVSQREQERLAYELHDQLSAYLAGVAFQAKALAERLDRRALPEAIDAQWLVGLVNDAAGQVRKLAHLLAPVQGAGGDLSLALSGLGADMESLFGITCLVEVDRDLPALTGEQCHQLFLIAQEAARNAVRHGQAQSVEISVQREPDALNLVVRSDGKSCPIPDDVALGLGLRIMRYRAGLLGGTFAFTSEENAATVVVCRVPLERDLNLSADSAPPTRFAA